MTAWTVERWGGSERHKCRVVFKGSEARAREHYMNIYLMLRRGSVALIDHDGKIIRSYNAGQQRRSAGKIVEVTR